ncbi:aminotransferase class I/II-fold pyridoxal phosphate-dependent enzyme [Nannocystis pusilla]|uniref:aminotransferase class I/II-fold pyridoxal phosphate-dependent enzyme n=1 Tax=Nannocystis pusilla TaxID=889268 RepID=UPI003B75DFD9
MFSRRTAWPAADEPPLVAGPGVLDLTISNPTAVGLRHSPDLWASLADPGSAAYDPNPLGILPARAAVADYYRARVPGLDLDLADICLLAGTSEAYAHLLALLCDPGDVVLVPQPGYPLLPMIADLAHVELRPYPLLYDGTWSIDLHALEAAVCPRTRAIVLVAPNNPTGNYLAAAELAAIDALAAARGLAVLVDEVFFDYPIGHVPEDSPIAGARRPSPSSCPACRRSPPCRSSSSPGPSRAALARSYARPCAGSSSSPTPTSAPPPRCSGPPAASSPPPRPCRRRSAPASAPTSTACAAPASAPRSASSTSRPAGPPSSACRTCSTTAAAAGRASCCTPAS